MVKNADKIGGGTATLNDNRITKIDAFIRKVKFDEIANLICVTNGTMSFIGDSGIIETTRKNLDFTQVLVF
ncbi:sugar transferase [Ruminococcus turbiniformis]|nr:sugar transferase [Ruminococcus turbiniformis]